VGKEMRRKGEEREGYLYMEEEGGGLCLGIYVVFLVNLYLSLSMTCDLLLYCSLPSLSF
jgi:hypothetical protein